MGKDISKMPTLDAISKIIKETGVKEKYKEKVEKAEKEKAKKQD